MNEFADIFAFDLSTTVFLAASASFLVALAAAAMWITRSKWRRRGRRR
jgi:hypothetical protein